MTREVTKVCQKDEAHKYQQKDNQDKTQGAGDSKPHAGEIKMISGGLIAGETLQSLKKANGKEINSVHSWLPLIKMPKNDKPDIVFSEKDGCSIRQPYDDPLVIMLRVKEFNIHRVLLTTEAQQISFTCLCFSI